MRTGACLPAVAGVLVEVHARIHSQVKRGIDCSGDVLSQQLSGCRRLLLCLLANEKHAQRHDGGECEHGDHAERNRPAAPIYRRAGGRLIVLLVHLSATESTCMKTMVVRCDHRSTWRTPFENGFAASRKEHSCEKNKQIQLRLISLHRSSDKQTLITWNAAPKRGNVVQGLTIWNLHCRMPE